jgi:small subunit ribosomal protein S1
VVAAAPRAVTARAPTDLDALRAVADMDRTELDAMMAAFAPRKTVERLRQGQRVKGRVTRIGSDTVFLDVGQKADATIDRVELDAAVCVGDLVEAYVVSTKNGELHLTRSIGGDSVREMLDEAKANGIPVQGKVEKAGDHGFEVSLPGGVRAFCPISQMGPGGDVGDAAAWVGRTLTFKVLDVRGREAVVSHRSFAEEAEREAQAAAFATLREGEVHDAIVVTLRDFGAFVRLENGIEGLVHISNLSTKRVKHPSEAVKEGESVRVRVLGVDLARRRVDFGIRQAEEGAAATAAPRGPRPELSSGDATFGTFGALLGAVKVKK